MAYREVIDAYIGRFGRHVLASEDGKTPARPDPGGPTAAPVRAIFLGVIVTTMASIVFAMMQLGRERKVAQP